MYRHIHVLKGWIKKVVAVYVHVYTSLINMVIGDAIIGCNFLSFLLIKSIFRCREKLAKL